MRIAHLSDLHVLDLAGVSWTRFVNKRLTGLVNLRGWRKDAHPTALAERLVKTLVDDPVDHVVVTGDLTNLALESELAAARRVLEPLGGYTKLSVVPGNHDVYTGGAERARRFERYFGDWMWAPSEPQDYPWLKLIGTDERVALLGFGSAVARLPLLAMGVVAKPQLARLRSLGSQLSGTFPIALVHHNLHARGFRKDAMHGLTNRDAFLDTCRDVGVKLVLHGHTHVSHRFVRDGMDVIGSGSSTWSSTHPDHVARFNVYHVNGGRLSSVEVRRYDHESERFSALAL